MKLLENHHTIVLLDLIIEVIFCFILFCLPCFFYSFHFIQFSIGTFKIEHENGRLLLMKSLDREKKDVYHLKIKAENVIHHRRVGRDISTTIIDQNQQQQQQPLQQQQQHHYHHQALYQHLTTTENQNNHLAYDEALVVIHVMDENDNSPIFDNNDRPIVAAIPLEASFGFKVVKVNVSLFF